MNILRQIMRCASSATVLFIAICATSPAAAAEDKELGHHAGTITVPAGIKKSEVQDAIVSALSGRNWGVKSQDDKQVVGYLKQRSNEATVTFVYTETTIDLYCVGWAINKNTGAREKPEQPRGWLKFLQQDITRNFNRIVTTK